MADTTNTQVFYNTAIPRDWDNSEFGKNFSFLKSYSFSRAQLRKQKTSDEIQNIHYGDIHSTFKNEILDFEYDCEIEQDI